MTTTTPVQYGATITLQSGNDRMEITITSHDAQQLADEIDKIYRRVSETGVWVTITHF